MLNKRTQSEIDTFFSKFHQIPETVRKVTSSAFTQCRSKIKYTAFSSALLQLNDFFYSQYSYKKYYGYRLIAIDGSVFTLPRSIELIKEFGENVFPGNGKWIKAQVSFATDVLNNICTDATIGPFRDAEYIQALDLMSVLGEENLLLFDRGYFSRLFLRDVVGTGNQFCFRVQKHACREFIAFINSERKDYIDNINVEGDSIKVRFTKIALDSGEIEYLISSLFDCEVFTLAKLKKLYNMRWGVEEQYKDMKYAICIENFIGKTPNSIKQEFYANILTYNLAMMLCKSKIEKVSNTGEKKWKYKANKRAILAKIKQCFAKLFHKAF